MEEDTTLDFSFTLKQVGPTDLKSDSVLQSKHLGFPTIQHTTVPMATSSTPLGGEGTVTTEWPVAGLSRVMRHITGHNEEGQSVFMSSDCGDHHRVIGDKQAIGNIIYSTNSTPIELTDDADLKHAKENEVCF